VDTEEPNDWEGIDEVLSPFEPEIDDVDVSEVSEDRVPTAADAAPEATYVDWRKEDTEVVTYRVGNDVYPGIYAESRDGARAHCEATRGRILEANYVRGRAFFRVAKLVKEIK
jgi:hypothetical protein